MGSTGLIAQVYNKENLLKLKRLMASSEFLWSNDQLIDYIAGSLTRKEEEQLFVEDGQNFVGCNLFMSSYACINDRIEPIRWSHSTYLQDDYRRKYGLDLVLRSYEYRNVFGLGLTDTNRKIHDSLGSFNLDPSIAYVMKASQSKHVIKRNFENDKIKINSNVFKKIHCANDIIYPQNGIWNRKSLGVDFVRDANYIQKRFFDSPYNYNLYGISTPFSYDRLYFVTRTRMVRGERCLFLVDYRFSIEDKEAFPIILSALDYLANIQNIHNCYLFASFKFPVYNMGLEIEKYGKECQIITNVKSLSMTNSFVTPADSDCELIPFEQED